MNDNNRHDLDQKSALMGDLFPGLWKRIYDNLLVEGFTELQAMELLKAFIVGQAGGRAG